MKDSISRWVLATLLTLGTNAAPAQVSHSYVKLVNEGTAARRPSLPITLLELMRASLEIPADGIWAIQAEDMPSDTQWALADQDSAALIAASVLVAAGGSGKNDQTWTVNADWQSWTRELIRTAVSIRKSAKDKDLPQLSMQADHLQEICSNCHAKYRPEVPTDGDVRYPFYPKREIAK